MSYTIRMKGTDVAGASFLQQRSYPSERLCGGNQLEVNNVEADCGKTPGAPSILAQIKKLNVGTKTQSLSYYIQKPQGLQLLRKWTSPASSGVPPSSTPREWLKEAIR